MFVPPTAGSGTGGRPPRPTIPLGAGVPGARFPSRPPRPTINRPRPTIQLGGGGFAPPTAGAGTGGFAPPTAGTGTGGFAPPKAGTGTGGPPPINGTPQVMKQQKKVMGLFKNRRQATLIGLGLGVAASVAMNRRGQGVSPGRQSNARY